jgi:hypothetical protein
MFWGEFLGEVSGVDFSRGDLSLGNCPGGIVLRGFIQGLFSGGHCPRDLSKGKCPGGIVWGICPGDLSAGIFQGNLSYG